MLITARSKLGARVRCLDSAGNPIGTVFAANTTEGWIETYILRPPMENGLSQVFVDRKKREFAKVRLHTDFDIVTRKGRKLFQVRWTWIGKARPIETKYGSLPK